jgi:hypothetical protein
MALFGLGNFGEGFIEGLATSANKALQDDIKRINLRAEKVADFQVKRTVEEQEKRKKDLEDIEDALREAEGLFEKDDPRAAAYAASLLQEQGSASALKAFTNQLKESNVYKSGQSLANFMEMAEKDMPTGTRTDYANAFLGKPSLPSDYRLPESAASAGAGNLLDAIGLKPDVSSMVSEQVSEQMSAMGITEQAEITVSLPSGTFMREKFTIGNMTPSNRLTYINEQLANENNTPERITELQGMLTKTQDAVYVTGKEEDRLTVIESKISRAEGAERESLIKEAGNIRREIKLKEAEMKKQTEPLALLDAQIDIALADALESNNFDEYNKLKKQRDNIGKPVDPKEDIKEAKRELAVRVKSGELDINSDEFKNAEAAIRQDEIIIDQIYGEGGELDLTAAKSIAEFMQTAVDNDIADKLTGEQRDLFNKASDALSKYNGNREMFKTTDPVLYQQYMDIVAANKDIENAAIERFLSGISESDKKNRTNALFAAQSAFNYGGQAQAAAAQAVSEVQGDGAAVTGGEAPVVGGEGAVPDAASADSAVNLKKKFSDDKAGATKMVNAILRSGIDMEAAIADASTKGYGKDFMDVLEENRGVDSTMAKMAIEDSAIRTDKDEVSQAVDIVDRFHNSALAPNIVAQPSKVNRLVREALGLGNTDRDKERANQIIEQARQRLVERDKKPTGAVSRITGRVRQASGGLMSRG